MQVAVCPLRDRKELPRSRSQAASNRGHLRWHTRTTQLTLCTHACMPCATKCFWTPCNALINSSILGAEVLEDTEKQVPHNAGNESLEILPCSRSPPWKFPTAKYTKALGKKPKCTVQRKTTTQNIRLQRKKSFLSQIWWFAYPSAQGINMLGTWRKKKKYTHFLFQYNYCMHPPERMLLSFSNPDTSKGNKGNERDPLRVKNESTKVWGEKRGKEGIHPPWPQQVANTNTKFLSFTKQKNVATQRFWTRLSYLSRDEQKPTTKKQQQQHTHQVRSL